ncbi:MAG: phosphate transport system regulatory protein PhoU [Arachnia propionica]|nr:MAG: phosphate transport system regulatory protein PhoU [Arachnia propionica]
MRASYHDELQMVVDRINEMSALVGTAIQNASAALMEADISKAESVITEDAKLDEMHEELEFKCLSLLALQAPVASELRTIVSAIRVVFELARMGDLSAHIAKIARLRYPNHAVPAELTENFQRMAEVSCEMMTLTHGTLVERDLENAQRMAEIDAEMDELRRAHFDVVLAEDFTGTTENAIDVALLGRYFERFADHAVAVARRVIYIITGSTPEGEEWPNA